RADLVTGFRRVLFRSRFRKQLNWTWYFAGTRTRDLPGVGDDPSGTGEMHRGWALYQELFYNGKVYHGGFWVTDKSRQYRTDLGRSEERRVGKRGGGRG